MRAGMLQLMGFIASACGCAVAPGRGVTLFPEGHRLTPEARTVRDACKDSRDLSRELYRVQPPAYTIEPGDIILVQCLDVDSPNRFQGDQTVLPDGTINLGKWGQHQVVGKTISEVESMLASQLVPTKTPSGLTVRLIGRTNKVYYVLGEVNAPGAISFQGRETVLDAILAAGGLTDRASRSEIVLARPTPCGSSRLVLGVRYLDIVQLGDVSTNYMLSPGDRIYVSSSSIWDELFHASKKNRR